MICSTCGKEITEDWRLDKETRKNVPLSYCSRSCCNRRNPSANTKDKISSSLQKGHASGRIKVWNKGIKKNLFVFSSFRRKEPPLSILMLSKRTVTKIMHRLNMPCSYPGCGWRVEGVVGDIHHIIPKNKGGEDNHRNLTYICPNCHREAHSGKKDIQSFVSLEVYIGDRWKDVYFQKTQ